MSLDSRCSNALFEASVLWDLSCAACLRELCPHALCGKAAKRSGRFGVPKMGVQNLKVDSRPSRFEPPFLIPKSGRLSAAVSEQLVCDFLKRAFFFGTLALHSLWPSFAHHDSWSAGLVPRDAVSLCGAGWSGC